MKFSMAIRCVCILGLFSHIQAQYHNNPNVWTADCAYVSGGGVPYTLFERTYLLGEKFPFLNITGKCFGSESHTLDPKTTKLTFTPALSALAYVIDLVSPTKINLSLKDKKSWGAEELGSFPAPLQVQVAFDGKGISVGVAVATLVKQDHIYLLGETNLTHKPHVAAAAEIFEIEGNGFRPYAMFNGKIPKGMSRREPHFILGGGLAFGVDYYMHMATNHKAQLKLAPGRRWSTATGQGVYVVRMHNGGETFSSPHGGIVSFTPGGMPTASSTQGVRVATTAASAEVSVATTALSTFGSSLTITGRNFGAIKTGVVLRFQPNTPWYSDAMLALAEAQGCTGSGRIVASGALASSLGDYAGGGYNVALTARGYVGCNSSDSPGHECSRAFDGRDDTDWAVSDADGRGSWISVTFNKAYAISTLRYQQRAFGVRVKALQLRFSDGSTSELELSNSPYLETYPLTATYHTTSVEMTITAVYRKAPGVHHEAREPLTPGASTIELITCQGPQALTTQRPAQFPDKAREMLHASTADSWPYSGSGRDYNVSHVSNHQIVLDLNPGKSWSPGSVVAPLMLDAISVNNTGMVPVQVQVAALQPPPFVTPSYRVLRSDAPQVTLDGRHFDPSSDGFSIMLSTGALIGVDFDIASHTTTRATLQLRDNKDWLACDANRMAATGCSPTCAPGSTVCVMQVIGVTSFLGVTPMAIEIGLVLNLRSTSANKAALLVSDFDGSRLFRLRGDVSLEVSSLRRQHFSQFGVTDGVINPSAMTYDHDWGILYIASQAPDLRRTLLLLAYNTSEASTPLLFRKPMPQVRKARGLASGHHRQSQVQLVVKTDVAKMQSIQSNVKTLRLWRSTLRHDISRSLETPIGRIPLSGVTVESYNSASDPPQVTVNIVIISASLKQEADTMAKLQAHVRSITSNMNEHGDVSAPHRIYNVGFTATPVLQQQSKFVAVASQEQGCIVLYEAVSPTVRPSASSLQHRVSQAHLRNMTCDTTASKCKNSAGIPVNVNRATQSEFNVLVFGGAGWDLGGEIISWRQTNGPFRRLEDLKAQKPTGGLDTTGLPITKQLLGQEKFTKVRSRISIHDARACTADADCNAWDEIACHSRSSLSEREVNQAHSIAFSEFDPSTLYVTSESEGIITGIRLEDGSVRATTPRLGSYATGMAAGSTRVYIGPCEEKFALSGEFTCRNALEDGEPVTCKADADCHTYATQLTAGIEQAGASGGQLLFRSRIGAMWHGERWQDVEAPWRTKTMQRSEIPFSKTSQIGEVPKILLFNGAAPVLGDYLQDPELVQVEAIQVHAVAGLLVAQGGQIRRYNATTGEFLHVIVHLGDVDISDFMLL